jgi:excisionase family DNA binding protein
MIEMPEIMTPEQVATYLQVNTKTIYRYIREGKLSAIRLGRHYRVSGANLSVFLRAQSTPLVSSPDSDGRSHKEAMLEAIEQATALRAEIRREMGGRLFPSVVDLLHEAREDDLP